MAFITSIVVLVALSSQPGLTDSHCYSHKWRAGILVDETWCSNLEFATVNLIELILGGKQ